MENIAWLFLIILLLILLIFTLVIYLIIILRKQNDELDRKEPEDNITDKFNEPHKKEPDKVIENKTEMHMQENIGERPLVGELDSEELSPSFPSTSLNYHKKENKYIKRGFILGIVSIFVGGSIGIIPLTAIVFSVLGLAKFDPTIHEKRWKGFVGLALGIIYFLLNMYNYGHININNNNNDRVGNIDNFRREYNYVSSNDKVPSEGMYSVKNETSAGLEKGNRLNENISNDRKLDCNDNILTYNVEEVEEVSGKSKDNSSKISIGSGQLKKKF